MGWLHAWRVMPTHRLAAFDVVAPPGLVTGGGLSASDLVWRGLRTGIGFGVDGLRLVNQEQENSMKNTVRNSRAWLGAIFGAIAFLASVSASAQSEEERSAQVAVRYAIQQHFNTSRVFFNTTKSSFMSLTEVKVTGDGYFTRSGNWGSETFTFSVKVRKSDQRTRDATVTLSNGETLTDYTDWTVPSGGEAFIGRFTMPNRYTNYPSGSVTFEGVLRVPNADLKIYDRDGRMVKQRQVSERNGRFTITESLPRGMYRAVLGLGRMADSDEVRFSVGGWDNPDWGWGGSGGSGEVEIVQPRNGDSVSDGMVMFRGNSSARQVNVRVYDPRGSVVMSETVPVEKGRWRAGTKLDNGRHRLVVSGGRGSDEVWFTVNGPGGRPDGEVVVTYPRNEAVVSGGQVNVQGTGIVRNVNIRIFDARGKLMSNETVPVRNNRWSVSQRLDSGRYRIVARAVGGKDSDEVWFTMGPGGSLEDSVVITYPRTNGTVSSMRVEIQGTSTESDVRVMVYDARGKLVHNTSIAVRGGRWSTSFNVPDGRYRIKASAGRDTDEQWFTRAGNDKPTFRGGG
jgi:hypothetical protein